MIELQVPVKEYEPAGRCVYCFKTRDQLAKDLSREHIIPFALEGHLAISKACCETCQRIINQQIEQVLLNDMFWNIRFSAKLQKRNPDDRPERLEFEFVDKNGSPSEAVPAGEYSQYLALPFFSPAALPEHGQDAEETDSGICITVPPKHIDRHRTLLEDREIKLQNVNRQAFCRLLAKIAHSYAYAEIGYQRLQTYRLLLPDLILENHPKWWLWVGGDGPKTAPEKNVLHKIGRGTFQVGDKEYFVIDLRIFAFMGTPQYRILVGERTLP